MAKPPKKPPVDSDSTTFRDLVPDVSPLPAGPRVVPALPVHADAVVVRARPKRSLSIEDTNGSVVAWATDTTARAARDLGNAVPDHAYRRLDLHRMSAARALHALTTALTQARADGEPYLLVICGKGSHSGATGPVLSRLVVDELVGPLADHVVAFRTAPSRLGGEGAIIVGVRKRTQSRPR